MNADFLAKGVTTIEALLGEKFLLSFLGFTQVVAKVSKHLGGVGVSQLLAAELDDESVEYRVDGDGA